MVALTLVCLSFNVANAVTVFCNKVEPATVVVPRTSAGTLIRPAPGAKLWVCPAGSPGNPCNASVAIYSPLGIQITNPMTADANGNFGTVCVATPSRYMLQVGGAGLTTNVADGIIFPGDPNSPTFSGTVTAGSFIGGSSVSPNSFGPSTVTSFNAGFALTVSGTNSINTSGAVIVGGPLTINGGGATGNVGLKYPAADHVVYLSPNGSDSNDGLSPGTAKLSPQAAFNLATTSGTVSGTVLVAPGNYSCPTTWYSNMNILSFGRQLPFANVTDWGFVTTQNGALFGCITGSNVVIGPDVTNLVVDGIGINFANSGGGLVLNSVSSSKFMHFSLELAGNATQAAMEIKVNASSGVTHNTAVNIFDDVNILANTAGVGTQANGLTLTGQGTVNLGVGVTDNRFTNLTIAGGLKNAIVFRLNTDSNTFNGVQVNNTGTAQGDVIVFNDLVPASDQDADGMSLFGVVSTGAFNHPISMGQSAGNNIQISSAAEVVPNILGGTPSWIVETVGLGGVPMGLSINGIIRFKSSNFATGSDVIQMANGSAAAPPFSFAENTNTGFWKRSTLNEMILAINGVNFFDFFNKGVRINGALGGYLFAPNDPSTNAEDTGVWRGAAKQVNIGGVAAGDSSGALKVAGVIAGGTAAGLTGTGACATITTQTGGANGGRATCTGVTAASTFIITPGNGVTAPNGWICTAFDQTTRANLLQQTSTTATACTLTATSITQNDVIVFTAMAF